MKANELQIGDWVQIVEPCKYAGAIGRVKTLIDHKDDENTYFKVFLRNNTIHIGIEDICSDDIRPIPLTIEILEKNGFVYREAEETCATEAYHMWDLKGIKGTSFSLNDDSWWRKCKDDILRVKFGLCDIEYVHQLQHALRLCGIEKEIEL